jgi:acyl-CoA reductase-like NAD-dependent aldehyde dehydrogenase
MSTASIPSRSLHEQVQAARTAQPEWARQSVRHRLRPVRALRRLLVAECDNLCAAVARDIGKSTEETLGGDLLPLADGCRFLEQEAERLLQPRRVPLRLRPLWLWGQRDTVHRQPRGVVGIIGTWNYPLFLNGVQIVQALTAGNAVVWKPSEVSPSCAALLHHLLLQAGFPAALVQLLEATREAGAALLDADINHLVFTGAASTGRRIASHLGERLISSTLELSGCDACFVLEDADVALAARAAWFGAVLNRGQTCLGVRRAFVQRSVYAAFCEQLAQQAAGAVPLSLALVAQVQQAERLVQAALAEGGRLLSPSRRSPGNGKADSFQPAVIADARPEMSLCREASFAPILAVMPFETPDQALAMEALCSYALGASIFTRSPRRATVLASRLRTGMVTVNDVIVPTAHPGTPLGGRGDSGWGVTQGGEGLLEMTVPQVVSLRTDKLRLHYDLTDPRGTPRGELLRGLLESGHGATFGQRWGGWGRLLRAFWKGK